MSKAFENVKFDLAKARQELDEFTSLLTNKACLDERKDVLPFFKNRKQLCLLIGMLHGDTGIPDKVAHEYDVCGDFACDLAVADTDTHRYTLIEFENGQKTSVFGTKAHCPPWASRFEHGFSQLIDWFWRLSEFRFDPNFCDRFSSVSAKFYGVLVIGRSSNIEPRERRRLIWRQDKLVVDSSTFSYFTFDDLRDRLLIRLNRLEQIASLKKPRAKRAKI